MPGGKVVLLDINQLSRVEAGERWRVRLRHMVSFAIAEPIDLAREPLLPNLVLPPSFHVPTADPAPPAALRSAAPLSSLSLPARSAPPSPAIRTPPADPPGTAARPAQKPALGPGPAPPSIAVAPAAAAHAMCPADVIRTTDRIAMFVDGANMDGACRAAGYFIDYRKAREFFVACGRFYAGFYYIADFTASDPLQQRYLDFLSHAGYTSAAGRSR